MSHNTLEDYYALNFALKNNPDSIWTVQEIEELIPFERDIYVDMLIQYLEMKKQAEKE